MATTGRGGTVLASLRCNFELKASETGFARFFDVKTPGKDSINPSQVLLRCGMSLSSATEIVVKKAILNFSLDCRACLISLLPIFEEDNTDSALLRHSSIDLSSTPSRRLRL